MTFEKILVVESDKHTKNHLDSCATIRDFLDKSQANYDWIGYKDVSPEFFDDSDLIMTLGGDGVFIRASHFVRDTPILGIHSDSDNSEGALTSMKTDVKKLEKILDGDYDTVSVTRARAIRNGELIPELAINEVYAGAEIRFHTSRYKLNYLGKEEEQRSAGVIISTGTGSPAWYNSARGKKFSSLSEELRFVVTERYKGKVFRPKIRKGKINQDNKFEMESSRYSGGAIAIDGMNVYDFNMGDKVEVRPSRQKLNVIKVKKENKLKQLFGWEAKK